jgi:hypothetical protein
VTIHGDFVTEAKAKKRDSNFFFLIQ